MNPLIPNPGKAGEESAMPQPPVRGRILAFPYSHTLSHVSRPFLLAMELRKRNFEVVFAGQNRPSFLEQNGFTVMPVYEPDPRQLYGNIRSGKLRFVSDNEVEKMIQSDLALYDAVRPDLILSDGRFTAPLSAHIADLRHAAIVNVSSTEYRANAYVPIFDWIPSGILGRNTALWSGIERLNLGLEMTIFDHAMGVFSKKSRGLGMKKLITATNCLTGKDLTLLADVPEYFPTRNLPPDYHYIGPLTLKTGIQPPAWWPPKRKTGPLIYVTMGTTGISDFFYRIHELITRTDLTAVMTTGGQVDSLKSVEGTIYLDKFLDGDLVMEECDLVVCHGGNGTIYQALQHGKPVIGIPTIPDQKFNMRRVEALGMGLTITWDAFEANPAGLLKQIDVVARTQTFVQNAVRMKSVIDHYDGSKLGADLIEQCLARS